MARKSKKPATEKLQAMYTIMSQSEIARAYDVSVRTVARWLHDDKIVKPVQAAGGARQ